MEDIKQDSAEATPTVKRGSERKKMADQLTPQQHQCIELLLQGWQQKDIAEELGVDENTICRWKKQKVFARWLQRSSKKAVETGMAILQTNFTGAVQRLVQISEQDGNRVQLDATKHIIKIVLEDNLLKEIQERLEKLEAGANREP